MQFFMGEISGTPVWLWAGFLVFVVSLMVFDLGVLHRKSHVIGMGESLRLTSFYIALAVSFGAILYAWRGPHDAFLFLTGYVVELSLSMDNIFVIAVIMGYFAIPREFQHRVLFYGILGVIILRGIMIVAGAAIIAQYHWVLYLFAAFLVITGIKMLMSGDEQYDVSKNPVQRFLRRYFPVTEGFRDERFVVREIDEKTGRSRLFITPMLVALCVVEVADVIFALDSIPAIFAITTDPFIIFTSNIFAILGLRAMFFALSALLHRFAYLKYALSLVLVFIGGKILVADLLGWGHVSPGWSLTITLAILSAGAIVSIISTARQRPVGITGHMQHGESATDTQRPNEGN